jgi:hypothetical protein
LRGPFRVEPTHPLRPRWIALCCGEPNLRAAHFGSHFGRHLGITVATFAACVVGGRPAIAAPIILNDGFETGFSSWTRADQLGSDGSFLLQAGTLSPVNGNAVPAPPGGVQAAMTDAGAPGSHVLYQDFVVDRSPAVLSFDLFLGNRGGAFVTANPATVGLDFSTAALNQQARVDILRSGANPFSIAASDVLCKATRSAPNTTGRCGWVRLAASLRSAGMAAACIE